MVRLNGAKKEPKIPVMELFGPTIQGEGIMTGTVTHFLRTGGCGLRCVWCDSMFAVEPAQIKEHRTMMTLMEIYEYVKNQMPWAPYITFTGGDPCLQKHLGELILPFNSLQMRVAIETQGMLFPDWLSLCDVLTFSPKGPSSSNLVDPEPLAKWLATPIEEGGNGGKYRKNKVCIKVVVFDEADFDYAMRVYKMIPEVLYDAFYFTAGTPCPEPDPAERVTGVLQNQLGLAELMLDKHRQPQNGFNSKVHLGSQQHVLLWPSEDKGV